MFSKNTFDELFSINFCLSKAIIFRNIGITVCSARVGLLIVIHSDKCHINLLMSKFCYFLQTCLHVWFSMKTLSIIGFCFFINLQHICTYSQAHKIENRLCHTLRLTEMKTQRKWNVELVAFAILCSTKTWFGIRKKGNNS